MPTIGTIRLKINKFAVDEFLVVAKNFPLSTSVILGAHFCEINTAKIDFETNIFANGRVRIPYKISLTALIPGKTTKYVAARARHDVTEGLIARTELGIQGVYVPPCRVKNFGVEVLVPIRNDNLETMKIRLPVVPLVTVEEKTYYKHWLGAKLPDYPDDDASEYIGPVPIHNQTPFLLDSIKQNNQLRIQILHSRKPPRKQMALKMLHSRRPPRKQTAVQILHSRKPPRKQMDLQISHSR